MGLETEYATIVADPQNLDQEDLPPSLLVYEQVCEAIRRDQPTARGLFDAEQFFLASGGAVSFESHPSMHNSPGGLIEIATPEVRSPEELLACQRSLDQLVADATAESETSFELRVLKNSSDGLGHVYGCQENYESEVAKGIWLVLYRSLITILWGMQVLSLLVSLPLLGGMFVLGWFSSRFRKPKEHHVEDEFETHGAIFDSISPEMVNAFVKLLRFIHFPTVMLLRVVVKHVAFRPQRRYLTSFLASRMALCATGNLDHEGRYRLSAKAMAIDSISDMGGFRGERPVFVFGHWLSQFCAKSFLSLASTRAMYSRQQRLQIGLSDSNMADLPEYVKFASVSLVLDMIEAGETGTLPVLKHPVESIHRIASDWNLITRVPTNRGEMSALEIQREFLNSAKRFVENTSIQWRGESTIVLSRWQELIDAIGEFRLDSNSTNAAMGKVDWLSKHVLIQALGQKASWTDRKKIDLRYHELSSEGYFSRLLKGKPEVSLLNQEQIDRRRRSPPPGSPAARRGWMIREFAGSEESIHTDWTYAMIGRGRNRKRVNFKTQKVSF